MTLSITTLCYYAECCVLFIIMLSVVMLNIVMMNVVMMNVVMLNVIMLNVVMLNVVMLSVVVPHKGFHFSSLQALLTNIRPGWKSQGGRN